MMQMLDCNEIEAGRTLMAMALSRGASKARVSVSKSTMDLVGTLDGEIDKVTHCLDRSLTLSLFAGGRYGSYATNRFDASSMETFVDNALRMTLMLAEDPLRDLPGPQRIAQDARTGYETGLYDDSYEAMTPSLRRSIALEASVFRQRGVLSEEGEYSDSVTDTVVMDTNGAYCRHIESSFEYGVEITVQDTGGLKYSSYHWDASPRLDALDVVATGQTALEKALSQIGPRRVKGGRYNMVIDTEAASKSISSILRALNGYSLQQNDSFLVDSLGRQLFPEGLTILDEARKHGVSGSRLFDSEGVATKDTAIIDHGVVRQYFINTYMSGKMGVAPTVEDYSHPRVLPWPRPGMTRDELLELCGDGILVTGFNGGNSNSVTGDFSYGIEGFRFQDGAITSPVREMVVTGNFLRLWEKLIAIADDARECCPKMVPSVAFGDVDFCE